MNKNIENMAKIADFTKQEIENLKPRLEEFAKLIIKDCIAQNKVAIQTLKDDQELQIPGWNTFILSVRKTPSFRSVISAHQQLVAEY